MKEALHNSPIPQTNEVMVASVTPGHEHSEIVGLRSRVYEVENLQLSGQLSGKITS